MFEILDYCSRCTRPCENFGSSNSCNTEEERLEKIESEQAEG